MSEVVIRVEGLSKKYQLGTIGTGTLSRDLNQLWAKLRGKENPYSHLESESRNFQKDDFWALNDINFDVKHGDVLGIIGKNGAGKSTLLKILSRVTTPTQGEIKIKGRIASLLEVGTGFHPELTGRENIFLNGAILGMNKNEISRKLDEIIAFSGVERHIDTPVKRYSSGMNVRLAFAVAAHLEPEILIVDEVLAVGDAEFQKKCLGKMKDASGEGRTILFVSHNMGALQALCHRGILLHSGKLIFDGSVGQAIDAYSQLTFSPSRAEMKSDPTDIGHDLREARIVSVRIVDRFDKVSHIIRDNEDFFVEIDYQNQEEGTSLTCNIQLYSENGIFVLSSGNWASTTSNIDAYSNKLFQKGLYRSRLKLPAYFLNEGGYLINALINRDASISVFAIEEAVSFTIVDSGEMKKEYTGTFGGVVRPKLEWNTQSMERNQVKH